MLVKKKQLYTGFLQKVMNQLVIKGKGTVGVGRMLATTKKDIYLRWTLTAEFDLIE